MVTYTYESLAARHIQDHASAKSLEPHWGYAARVVPCANDPGSCAYLDVVYNSHDNGILYMGVLWLTIFAVIMVWALLRHVGRPPSSSTTARDAQTQKSSGLKRARRALAASVRRHLLPESVRAIFGRTSRLQVVILAVLCGYLTIWTFVGITYNTWITPVKKMPGVYNTRTSLGPWSNRIGVVAYALTPLSVMLSSRESILSLLTGVPYQSFNFLHRWLGYVIFVQSSVHTIGWSVIQIRLYQPQPTVGLTWVKETYIVWGLVAMILLTLLLVLSTPWAIRRTGYEFFRKSHYVLAMIYVGACWAHWEPLKCFLIPSLIIWFLDRGARLVRTALLHYHHFPSGAMGFQPANAAITSFSDPEHGDVIRLDLASNQDPWTVGQHYYLCFPESSIWQSHPFTPLNAPIVEDGEVKHSYIMRAKGGETKKLAELAAAKAGGASRQTTISVILTGAYGESLMERTTSDTNIVCVAGGTGITYVLPLLLQLAREPASPDRRVELIWAMRHANNAEWVKEEMKSLRCVQRKLNLTIRLFATRDTSSDSNSSLPDEKHSSSKVTDKTTTSASGDVACDCPTDVSVEKIGGGTADIEKHPNLPHLLEEFIESTIQGPTTVFASGPGGMISDLRTVVAGCNSGSRVWKGEERFYVSLVCDNRLEY